VISKETRDKCHVLLVALMFMALGMIGVLTGEFWAPRAKRSIGGVWGRIFGGIALIIGTGLLIGWIFAVTGPGPDPTDGVSAVPRHPGRDRKRKPRPIDPDEEIAARALGLDSGETVEGKGAGPPPA
jgi:hypothetical protein